MTFRELKVKELMGDAKLKAVLVEFAPSIAKNPAAKLMGNKTCGEVFDLVVSKKLISKEAADKVEAGVNALLK